MGSHDRSQKEFNNLYEQFLPQLYRGALYLLGNRKSAETAAQRAWLQAMATGNGDARAFSLEALRLLAQYCKALAESADYQIGEVSEANTIRAMELLLPLSQMDYGTRLLVVLSAVLGLSAGEVARVLRVPEWLVQIRLQNAVEKLCRNRESSVVFN